MNKQELLRQLAFHNPWWETGSVPQAFTPPFKRFVFSQLQSFLDLPRIVMLKGPRRTGKTTLLYQLIAQLLKKGVKPKDILYLSFDDPLLRLPLPEILAAFESFRGQELSVSPSFIFFDEAQFVPDWELTVKLYFDRQYPMKFFISGSSVSLLTQKVDSLAGRTIEETLLPFSFGEMVLLQSPSPELEKAILGLQGQVLFKEFPPSLAPFEKRLKLALERYLTFGGFPHLLATPEALWPKLLREDLVQKVVFRDLVERFKVREPSSLERLLGFLGKNTAGIVNTTTLAASLGLSRPVVEQYLSYLEQSLLFFRLTKFSHSGKERLRSNPKGHLIDPGLSFIFGANPDQLLETAVADSLFAKYQDKLSFWRDQNHEVDLLVEDDGLLPIEVKNNASQELPASLLYFMEKEKLARGIVVYQGDFGHKTAKGKTVYFLPVFLFLLA